MSSEDTFREEVEERPVRDKLEGATDKIPEGPRGKIGGGNLLGAGGYVAVEATRPLFTLIPGLRQPGYTITSHSTEKTGEGTERHTLMVTALTEDVAEFAAEYNSAASNIDYFRSDVENIKVEKVTERGTYSTFNIVVDVMTEGAD